jgi:hypothetical protein
MRRFAVVAVMASLILLSAIVVAVSAAESPEDVAAQIKALQKERVEALKTLLDI